jgi:hypothetical protein
MAAMKGARISGGGPYSLHVDNQFGFTCTVEFNDEGRPSRVSACSAPDGWHFRSQGFGLRCAVNKQTKYEVCSGSTGGVASNIDPNHYDFDGFSIARKLRQSSESGGTSPPPASLCNAANIGKSAGVCPAGQQCTCRNVGGMMTPQHCACETPPAAGTCGDTGQRCGGGQKCCRQPHSGAPYFCTAPDDSLICDG